MGSGWWGEYKLSFFPSKTALLGTFSLLGKYSIHSRSTLSQNCSSPLLLSFTVPFPFVFPDAVQVLRDTLFPLYRVPRHLKAECSYESVYKPK